MSKRLLHVGMLVAALAVLFAILSAPGGAGAADHLDGGFLVPADGNPQADINDIFVFDASVPNKTALVMTTNPLAGVVSPESFATDIIYMFRVDKNGDARADVAFKLMFGPPNEIGAQAVTVKQATGRDARLNNFDGTVIGGGSTESAFRVAAGGKVWAGLASDPFFFDLEGFLGSVEGVGDRAFLDGDENDFFDGLNVMGITLQVRDEELGSGVIGVWGATATISGSQVDRMGFPAINTVFDAAVFGGHPNEKQFYNRRRPVLDVAKYHDLFSDRLVALTTLLGAPYTDAEADGIMDLLLPDIMPYDLSTAASGPLNGRRLMDDVIDIELGIVTNGVVPGDGVGPHSDYKPNFPYLGNPN